jgi:hypothetical protein
MMKKLILLVCLGLCFNATMSQSERATTYINTYKELAIAEMIRSGVPASITLAQGILESDYGESELAQKSNNHFGIKCKTEWTGPKTYHDDDERGECFRVYASAAASYRDHSDFLKNRPYYTDLFKLDPTDDAGWAYGLKKAGYATERDYPQRLLKLINDYDLHKYNLVALDRIKNGTPASNTTASVKAVSEDAVPGSINLAPTKTTVTEETMEEDHAEENLPHASTVTSKKVRPSNYPAGTIFTINHTKVIYAAEGTSLLALAGQYDISLGKLLDFNELKEMDVLDTDRLLFLERKMKRGATDIHIVSENESLYDIAQKEGVRMESLMEYNNLKKDTRLSAGQKLNLRAAGPVVAKSTKASK